jgi:uncharacterized protein
MEKGWRGLPYHTIGDHYKKIFGEKVYKLPVAVVDDCPNRRGLKGMKTCSFCDVWGSAARTESFAMDLRQQIETYQKDIGRKYKSQKFLVYFQAYTNTFDKISRLRENFETALSYPFVEGFVLGTRPDCLSKAVLDLWQEYSERSFVAIEMGVQSFFDHHLEFMDRGHTVDDSVRALEKIAEQTRVDLGIHLIFGSPNESLAEIKESALRCNDLPISNVKLHNLHVLKNTTLAQRYARGEFTPISREEYTERVLTFVSYLHPRIAIQRLAALASRWDELIAPSWTADKMGSHQFIIDQMRLQKIYQGRALGESFPSLVASSPVQFAEMAARGEPILSNT